MLEFDVNLYSANLGEIRNNLVTRRGELALFRRTRAVNRGNQSDVCLVIPADGADVLVAGDTLSLHTAVMLDYLKDEPTLTPNSVFGPTWPLILMVSEIGGRLEVVFGDEEVWSRVRRGSVDRVTEKDLDQLFKWRSVHPVRQPKVNFGTP